MEGGRKQMQKKGNKPGSSHIKNRTPWGWRCQAYYEATPTKTNYFLSSQALASHHFHKHTVEQQQAKKRKRTRDTRQPEDQIKEVPGEAQRRVEGFDQPTDEDQQYHDGYEGGNGHQSGDDHSTEEKDVGENDEQWEDEEEEGDGSYVKDGEDYIFGSGVEDSMVMET